MYAQYATIRVTQRPCEKRRMKAKLEYRREPFPVASTHKVLKTASSSSTYTDFSNKLRYIDIIICFLSHKTNDN